MPWSKNHLPKYRKHRSSGQAIVTLSGVDHYLGPHGTKASRVEYDQLIAEWLANDRQPIVEENAITVVELISRFWKYARKVYVKNGKPTDEQAAHRAVDPVRRLY